MSTLSTPDGDKVRVMSVDANSGNFAEDFLYVFAKNVRAARRDNKALLGSPRGVKARS